jgi:hypothetical protein
MNPLSSDYTFKPISLDDKELITSYTRNVPYLLSCEYAFANLFNWQEDYDLRYTIINKRLVISSCNHSLLLHPIGGDTAPSPLELNEISKQCRSLTGGACNFYQVPKEYIEKEPTLTQFYKPEIDLDLADYIYETEKLISLTGSKLRKKRNHISQFKRKYPNYKVIEMTQENVGECFKFATYLNKIKQTALIDEEAKALRNGVQHFSALDMSGILIYVEEELAGFALGSFLGDDMFIIHFERANYKFTGITQLLNQETAKHYHATLYINREQDLGIEGLRKSKRSYAPKIVLENYTLNSR